MFEASGLVAFAAVVAVPVYWLFFRVPRHGKVLTPYNDGDRQVIAFRPGPPPLPEHDETPALAELVRAAARDSRHVRASAPRGACGELATAGERI